MWMFALRNLLSRPVRSMLALFGLSVAITGMVGLFSVAAGLQATLDRTFNRISGLIVMQPGTTIPLFSKLPDSWADEIAALPGVKRVCREVWGRANLVEGKTTFNPPRFLFGVDVQGMLQLESAVYRDDVTAGRFLNMDDLSQPHCLISEQIAQDYQKQVGDTLKVDGYELTIIGLYSTNSLLLDVAILTTPSMARTMIQIDEDVISSIFVDPDGSIPLKQLEDTIRENFRGRELYKDPAATNVNDALGALGLSFLSGTETKPVTPGSDQEAGDSRVDVRTVVELGQQIAQFSSDLDIFLILMNSIGIIIAVLSILNTMLMSVTERMTEFGILRANGWSAGDVMKLVLAESVMLGVIGGLLGCLLGYAGTLVLNAQFPSKLNLYASPQVLLLSFTFSMVLGALGGLYPAWWAIRRSPMEAIRRG